MTDKTDNSTIYQGYRSFGHWIYKVMKENILQMEQVVKLGQAKDNI
jgi:hypothetical protein